MVVNDVVLECLDHPEVQECLPRQIGQLLLLELEELHLSHGSLLIGVVVLVDELTLFIEVGVLLVPLDIGSLAHRDVVLSSVD